jgi:molybdenum cofactor cytidylyltransferase
MIAPAQVALVLLAAGRSMRFGPADKLAWPVRGDALGLHAARRLAAVPFGAHIAVTGGGVDYTALGYEHVPNDAPEMGQSRSIALGVARARGFAAVMIALADMPLVEEAHVMALLARVSGPSSMVASMGEHPCPPAVFGRDWFDALSTLEGDRGARTLLSGAVLVAASPASLTDIDTLKDLAESFGTDP